MPRLEALFGRRRLVRSAQTPSLVQVPVPVPVPVVVVVQAAQAAATRVVSLVKTPCLRAQPCLPHGG